MNPLYLVLIFIISSIVGYFVIKNVPSLLHTPLMSGMNALSGVSILGAIVAVGLSYHTSSSNMYLGQIIGGLAIICAAVNVMGGFGVTHRMLRMFNRKKQRQ